MKRLAILISGGGSTAEATIKACQTNQLTGLAPIVISSNRDARGNQKVKNLGIELYVIHRNDFIDKEKFNSSLFQLIERLEIDIISLQGWLLLIPASIVQKYKGKIMNQHPGPLDPGRPDFGGSGMSTPYRVNSALIAYIWATGSEPFLESDTHFITEEFDMGGIIRIEKMPFLRRKESVSMEEIRKHQEELIETTHALQKQFYSVEHHNVIETLQMFSDGDVSEWKRPIPLIPKENVEILNDAKKLAIELFPNYNL